MTSPDPYRALPNSFKRRLRAGETLIGCWCSLANPITTEVLGLAGFDWLLLDGEHAPNDVTTFIPQLMALKDSASAPVVRPSWNDAVEIKRLLDAGFYNILVPFVQTADDARRAVAATRYPPAGIRGVSVAQRNNRFGTSPTTSATSTRRSPCWSRSRAAPAWKRRPRSPRSTASTASSSVRPTSRPALGHLGKPGEASVQAAIAQVFAAAKSAGKPSGILTPVEADARRYLAMGATFVAVGSDLGVFRSATQQLRDRFARSG